MFSSCQPEVKSGKEEQVSLDGKWLVHKASRDGKLTQTLKDGFFEFKSPDVLINNLNRKEEVYKYTLNENIIEQRGKLNADYEVLKLVSDTLVLGTIIKDYKFAFLLLRDTISTDTISASVESD